MKPKIFISSPVYDLLDVRAEVEAHLSGIGFSVLMSDSSVSDFKVQPNANSIETCLVNLRESDYCVVILSRRYGPSLTKAGYDDISATHLEYREAVAAKIPVHFFIRDRLEADYAIWRKNKGKDPELNWVGQDDNDIFELIEEHKKLDRKKSRNNWYHTFRSSVDLKNALSAQLGYVAKKQRLMDDMANNRIPIFTCSTHVSKGPQSVRLNCTLKNVGTSPAFNMTTSWIENRSLQHKIPIVAPGEEILNSYRGSVARKDDRISLILLAEYSTYDGHLVCDEYEIKIIFHPEGGFKYASSLISKKYNIGKGDSVDTMIVEPEGPECN